ncbi:serine hydrolase domain-containing protein [Streptomyces sp. NPDC054956]
MPPHARLPRRALPLLPALAAVFLLVAAAGAFTAAALPAGPVTGASGSGSGAGSGSGSASATGPASGPAAGGSGATGPAAGHDLEPDTVRRLDSAITAVMERAGIPGLEIGLWMPGRGDYVRAFGVADERTGAPMEPGLSTRVGSVTKTFTVTALLQLADRGRLGLDDPVARYVDGVPGGEHITLRQLAGMRSGLYDYAADPGWREALRTDPRRAYTPAELLGHAFAHPANFAPGTEWEYSNTNTVLIGLVVERVSGQDLGGYLREHVFAPLGLTGTGIPGVAGFPGPRVHGSTDFTPTGAVADATDWNPSWAWAAGDAVSSLEDLHTWLPALVDGRLLEPATQAERLRTGPTGRAGASYGLGVLEVGGWIGHNGELPGYEALAVQLPELGATLVVLINSDVGRPGSTAAALIGEAVTSIATPDHVWNLPAAESGPGAASGAGVGSGAPGAPGPGGH